MGWGMCEFRVLLDGERVFEDAVFCRVQDGVLLLQDILGQSKRLSNCHVVEVNVAAERIVLESD
jgi:predicted RNA-binding protein